jgi:hypothetical protein
MDLACSPIDFVTLGELRGGASSSISIRDGDDGNNHALFDPTVNFLLTACRHVLADRIDVFR